MTGKGNINSMLIPNVSKLPKHKKVDVSNKLQPGQGQETSEFKNLLQEQIGDIKREHGLKLSTHAAKRLQERNLQMDSEEFFKLRDAMDKLKMKGGKDSLVITPNAAYILDVENNTIVTAIDKDNMAENVFTKIDSTLMVN
ncbi:MAG: flagellar protein [Deltaproteobacteria bacterium]|jgi:flagellar operon protein|nr:MAG: flagellar protein [Deltaproteobacteria bacterium]